MLDQGCGNDVVDRWHCDRRRRFPMLSRLLRHIAQAVARRDRLVHNDRRSDLLQRVIDDESDYYTTDGNKWLSSDQRE